MAEYPCMGGARGNRRRRGAINELDEHPNIDEILGVLSALPHIGDAELPVLAGLWRNTPYIAEARARALSPDSPLVIEVLSCFEALVALFDDDLAGEADYVTVDVKVTSTALKAVRDAIAAVYAKPLLSHGEFQALMRPWRQVFPARGYAEPYLGPNSVQVKQVLASMPLLAARCHDERGRRLFDSLMHTASTVSTDLRDTARDEAWRAAVLTSRRRMWAMLRRSGLEAISRRCLRCGAKESSSSQRMVYELCLDAACGLLVADAIDDTFTDILTLPLAMLIPGQRTSGLS
jgi:hypothetical protein